MLKPLALSIAVCLAFAGCQVFQKSETWEAVMRVHPGETIRDADPSAAYAEKLHRVLLEQGVEHIVVTYQFHYYTPHYEFAVHTRTAVVYRDNVNPSYPWWLKDDLLDTPFWLPNGTLESQIAFYTHRPVEILEKKVYPAHGGSGKDMKATVTLSHPAPAHQKPVAMTKPQPVTHVTVVKTAPAPATKPVVISHPAFEKPAPTTSISHPAAVTHIQHQPAPVTTARVSAAESAPVAVTHTNSSWSAPTAIDPVQQANDPAPRDEHLEKLFRQRNGSTYDPTSPTDRRKMGQLKRTLLGRENSEERGRKTSAEKENTAQF